MLNGVSYIGVSMKVITYNWDNEILAVMSIKSSGCVDRDKVLVISVGIFDVLDIIYSWAVMSNTPEVLNFTYILGFPASDILLDGLERYHLCVCHVGSEPDSEVRVIRNFSVKLDMSRIAH
jgi:hypothetical protein